MTLLEKFQLVDDQGKSVIVFEEGEFVITREYYGYKVNLYALPGFYVEVVYDPISNAITKIYAISDRKDLDKYLPWIEIKLD